MRSDPLTKPGSESGIDLISEPQWHTDPIGRLKSVRWLQGARPAARVLRSFARRMLPGADPQVFLERPYELHLELTNLCNAKCVFCPYTLQTRSHQFMSERIFKKAVDEYVRSGGGSVCLTPTVGDALIHPKFVEWVRYMRAIPQIDRITLTTNAILVRRHRAAAILDSGLSSINISTAGFDESMYRRIYRNDSYRQFRDGVYDLFEANARRAAPIPLFLSLRPDRPADEVLRDPDFQPLLKYRPKVEMIECFSRSGGLIQNLPEGMKLAPVSVARKRVPCNWTYRGLMVLSSGDVQVCACESSINANALVVGNIEQQSLLSIWRGARMRALRESFSNGTLNANCAKCDYYYDPVDLYSKEARQRARISRRRQRGEIVNGSAPITSPFQFE